jgi:hypothetical protein
MNEELAEIYGTQPEVSAEDQLIEKIAADLSEEGVDIDDLSEEELEEVAAAYEGAEGSEDGESAEDGEEKTAAQEKFAEADTMGRIMAHSMWQEVNLIKEAKSKPKGKGKPGFLARMKARASGAGASVVKHVKKFPKSYAGLGAAAAGGAGYALGRRGEKNSSGLDALIERKVVEVLEQLQQ